MDVVSLLESKNRCLHRFLGLSADFLLSADGGDFSRLEAFHKRRESTIKALELYDREVSSAIASLPASADRHAMADRIRAILDERDRIVREILNTDERIIARVEQEKARIAGELASSRKNQANINKFRSQWIPEAGEELDRKL